MKKVLLILCVAILVLMLATPCFAYTPPADAVEWKVYIIWGDDPTMIPYGTTVTLYNYQFDKASDWASIAGQRLSYTRVSDEPSVDFVGYSPQTLYGLNTSDWAVYDKYEQGLWRATDEKYQVEVDTYNLTDRAVWLSVSLADGVEPDPEPSEPSEPTEPTEPERDWELSGGYYIVCDSALGTDMTFYIPAEFAKGSLSFDETGNLFNLTSSSIYLYSPDFPDYTIYASRFSGFQYRTDSNYGTSYVPLKMNNVTDTNVEIFTENPELQSNFAGFDYQLIFFILIVVLLFLIWLSRR